MRLPLLIGLFVGLLSLPSLAQVQLYPLAPSGKVASPRSNNQAARAKATLLQLPFFDDFSTSQFRPDTNLWINGGVYVNNQFPFNAPTKGVATFDGLRFSGDPYNFAAAATQGPTDTLTSQSIDLSTLKVSDRVVLSFLWQAQGLGERPDFGDSLLVQFRLADTTWRNMLTLRDTVPGGPYTRDVLIPLTTSDLFHAKFRFRFLAFGRPSGLYDVWNIDYVYLNRNRQQTGRFSIRDLAVAATPRPLLKRYTAMPVDQFNANPAGEIAGTDSTAVNNLFNNFNFFSFTYTVREATTSTTLYNFQSSQTSAPLEILANQRRPIGVTLPATLIPQTASPKVLTSTFAISRDTTTVIRGVDLARNDTITRVAVLSDYYAYDDGTAEYGIGTRQRQGRVAVRFVLNKPDTLTAIKMYFTKLEKDLVGQTFVLSIWKNEGGKPGEVLYQSSSPIQYTNPLNTFHTYELKRGNQPVVVAVTDTFYVGWQQTTSDLLAVGYDINTDARPQLFQNIANNWDPVTLEQPGSVMIRPVLARTDITATEPETEDPFTGGKTTGLFPNPTTGLVRWTLPNVHTVRVLDVLGRMITQQTYQPTQSGSIGLGLLPEGIYVLHLQSARQTWVRKVVVKK